VEQYTNDFVHQANARSNSGLAPVVDLSVQTAHLRVAVNAMTLDLKPTGTSDFIPYRGTNGNFQVGFTPAGKLELQYYGGRNLTYSVQSGASYYLDERTGVAVASPLGWRATGRIYWEQGRNPYVASAAGGPTVTNHLTAYGGNLSLRIGRSASFVVGGSRSEYTSPVAEANRSIAQIQATLQLQSGEGQWW
jgi:hypothetical protein